MRRLWTAMLGVGLLATTLTPVQAGAGDPFTRSWSRTDIDGSRETLRFAGKGASKSFAYRDERATSCGGDPFEATGPAGVTGDVAILGGSGGCVGGATGPFGSTLTYSPTTRAIDDGSGPLWHRGNGAREAFQIGRAHV